MDASIIAVCHFSWKCSDYSLERTLSLVHQADTGRAALSIFPKPYIKLSSGHLSRLIYYNLYLFLLPPISGRSNVSVCRDCISIEDRTHDLELNKGFVVSSRVQGTELLPLSVLHDRRAVHGYKAYILAAWRRGGATWRGRGDRPSGYFGMHIACSAAHRGTCHSK